MEKNFTLMKTLTAFLDLLFPSRKNARAVNNAQTSTTGGCRTTTTVNDHLIYVNDAKQADASFLFFNQSIVDGQQSIDNGQQAIDTQQKLKTKEELKKVNDELAQRNIPKPAYNNKNNWRERVNDDLAACGPVVSRESVIVARESITVIDVLKNIFSFSNTIVHNETRTSKNDAFRPFASFYSLFTEALAKVNIHRSRGGRLITGTFIKIISAVTRSFQQDQFSKNSEPVFIPIRICDKSNMRFSQNRFNKKNQI